VCTYRQPSTLVHRLGDSVDGRSGTRRPPAVISVANRPRPRSALTAVRRRGPTDEGVCVSRPRVECCRQQRAVSRSSRMRARNLRGAIDGRASGPAVRAVRSRRGDGWVVAADPSTSAVSSPMGSIRTKRSFGAACHEEIGGGRRRTRGRHPSTSDTSGHRARAVMVAHDQPSAHRQSGITTRKVGERHDRAGTFDSVGVQAMVRTLDKRREEGGMYQRIVVASTSRLTETKHRRWPTACAISATWVSNC
jgi:hypothetical protein